MGCDIHTITEIRNPDGTWKPADIAAAFNWRNYGMFGFFADITNYSKVPPQWPHRGWPKDISPDVEERRADIDGHSDTYVTLAELLAFDYDQTFENRRVTRQISERHWSGAETAEPGGGVKTTYREFLGENYFDELKRLSTLGTPENIRVLMYFDN